MEEFFHICTKQFGEYTEFKGKGLLGAEAILSYSVVGVSYMAFVAAFWCASNTTIYPVDLYGEPLKLQFEFAPYFTDTVDLGSEHTAQELGLLILISTWDSFYKVIFGMH